MNTLTYTTLKLRVDYGQSVEEMVRAGNFDYASSSFISKDFPSRRQGKAELEVVLYPIPHFMKSGEIIDRMGESGLWVGEWVLPELLTIAIQYPDEQRRGPIVALGSVWRSPSGNRDVPYLWGGGSYRNLGLTWFGRSWPSHCRFLAFRK